ncbi:hypothetical protein HNR46_004091 [Haloferula luteola]|uniref:Nucleotidyl transferase AbiEii/AbiGii toxin family protein n=1 Tax=Haloferula luteola TaxID=595692 RepID=A0A840V6D7_9BACT|nr:nucleotidyl transferase AbiEii/AbiGii toxin family protein [Haloferula luteola]MBB5353827.1 hypothetical protein [Haloferula luteola]
MDAFATVPADEQEAYFNEAASRLSLPPHVVEKDFWVCWTLKRLFTLDGVSDTLLFKGGTSLSKVHGLIRRFSEDIDVSIHREHLGFSGADDPVSPGLSNKKREALKEQLAAAAAAHVAEVIAPALRTAIEGALSGGDGRTWSLEPDTTDPDGQSLAFFYPTTRLTQTATAYLRPAVKIEFGARSDHWPAEIRPLQPYLADAFPGALGDPTVEVKTMEAVRTFWEKATILHQMAHLPDGKPFPGRYSRHYTDLAAMVAAGTGVQAAEREDLLKAVVTHKIAFYRAAWARYEDAKRGTLRLLPAEKNMDDLKADLDSMREMFFDEPPAFDAVVTTLREWEDAFNQP